MDTQFRGKDTASCRYGLAEAPAGVEFVTAEAASNHRPGAEVPVRWSGSRVPAMGERVLVNFNDLGHGSVVAYFIEHGWLGVEVKLEKQPAWHLEQNGAGKHALVFGIELKLEAVAA